MHLKHVKNLFSHINVNPLCTGRNINCINENVIGFQFQFLSNLVTTNVQKLDVPGPDEIFCLC